MKIFTGIWFKAAGIRALKTFAQTAVAAIGVSSIQEVNWIFVISTAVVSAVLSLLTSVAGLPEIKINESEEEKNE